VETLLYRLGAWLDPQGMLSDLSEGFHAKTSLFA
jgi:hypothetical protein